MSSVHSKVSSTEHPPAFPSFLKHTTELLSPQAPASPSSLPSLPPTRPLPFRAPLRPVSSLNQPPVPLPPTLSSPFPTFTTLLPSAPSSYTFLPSLQGPPTPTTNAASTRRPLRPSPDAPTNPQPHPLLCSPLSCPRSNLTLAFVPSSQVWYILFGGIFWLQRALGPETGKALVAASHLTGSRCVLEKRGHRANMFEVWEIETRVTWVKVEMTKTWRPDCQNAALAATVAFEALPERCHEPWLRTVYHHNHNHTTKFDPSKDFIILWRPKPLTCPSKDCIYPYQLEPHKAVAEVSKIGNL